MSEKPAAHEMLATLALEAGLSAAESRAYFVVYGDGLPEAEAAVKLGITVNNLRVTLHGAGGKLRTAFERHAAEAEAALTPAEKRRRNICAALADFADGRSVVLFRRAS